MPILPLAAAEDVVSPWVWLAFAGLVVTVMALDLGVFHRESHKVEAREALAWVTVWISLAAVFNVALGFLYGWNRALEFTTGYLVEYALSVDNIFVFVMIFTFFSVPPVYQHRVLFWGIIGAVVMRLLFITVGFWILQLFTWFFYVLGGFLILTGIKLMNHEVEVHPERNWALRVTKYFLPVASGFHGDRFIVRVEGKLFFTPLFLVLIVVEATDVLFAVDSVPAILAVTKDRFVAFSSNVFAILGLRSLYFVLAGMMDKFHFLKYGLSLVLIFIGAKMCAHEWVDIHAVVSLSVVLTLLAASVLLSLAFPPKAKPLPQEESSGP